jgi:transposase, IS5 family
VARMTGELADLAERAAAEARLAAAGGKDAAAGRRRGRLRRAVAGLAQLLEATGQIAAQARQRLAGTMPDGATRRVSLHDPDARPIAKGRLGKPVEFGYKAQVTDNDDGVVLDYAVEQGNPTDGPQLAPAVERVIKRAGKTPRTVTADRSYGEQAVEDDLRALGVRHVAIPRKGRPGKARQGAERRPAFRRAVKWRTGCEGRISTLKRQYGWDRTRLDGTQGARTWTGYGILAHNLVKISTLAS